MPDNDKKPYVVVTGATGFLGRYLAAELLGKGYGVVAVVRKGSTMQGKLPEPTKGEEQRALSNMDEPRAALHMDGSLISAKRGISAKPGVSVEPGISVDYPNLVTVEADLSKAADAVPGICGAAQGTPAAWFHFAWGGVNRDEIDSRRAQQENIAMSMSCLEAARMCGCGVFVDAGSRVEYGIVDGPMREDLECHPVNEYGRAKLMYYRAARDGCETAGMRYVHLRFFSVYGVGDHPWSLVSTLARELSGGRSVDVSACLHRWNFMHVRDAATAVVAVYEAVSGGASPYNRTRKGPIDLDSLREGRQAEVSYALQEGASVAVYEAVSGGASVTDMKTDIVNIASADTRVLREFTEEILSITGNKGQLRYGAFEQAKEGALSVEPDITRLLALTGALPEPWRERYTFRRGVEEIAARSLN